MYFRSQISYIKKLKSFNIPVDISVWEKVLIIAKRHKLPLNVSKFFGVSKGN